MTTLLDKFPGLARYEKVPEPETAGEEVSFCDVYLDALKKTYDMAVQRYCGAFLSGINFLEWARLNVGSDYAAYQDKEIAVDELWCSIAPIERFRQALRDWAHSYLALARFCHIAVIADINDHLKDPYNGLG